MRICTSLSRCALVACFVRRSASRSACQSVRQPPPHLLVNGEWIFDGESYGPIKFQLRVHPLLTDILCTWPADIYRMYLLFTTRCGSTCANDISTLRENSHLSEFPHAALHQTFREKETVYSSQVFMCVKYSAISDCNFSNRFHGNEPENRLVYIKYKTTRSILFYIPDNFERD